MKKGDIIFTDTFDIFEKGRRGGKTKLTPLDAKRFAFFYLGQYDDDESLDPENYEAIMNTLGWFREDFIKKKGKKVRIGTRQPKRETKSEKV